MTIAADADGLRLAGAVGQRGGLGEDNRKIKQRRGQERTESHGRSISQARDVNFRLVEYVYQRDFEKPRPLRLKFLASMSRLDDYRRELKVAVLIPCYNEAAAIGKVVRDFRRALPMADVYVYDNNSTDDTCDRALEAGAHVGSETRQGKGHVVRRMFNEVDADIYVMVDGDDTYDASAAPALIDCLLKNNCAMVVGRRVHHAKEAYRPAHVFGNA